MNMYRIRTLTQNGRDTSVSESVRWLVGRHGAVRGLVRSVNFLDFGVESVAVVGGVPDRVDGTVWFHEAVRALDVTVDVAVLFGPSRRRWSGRSRYTRSCTGSVRTRVSARMSLVRSKPVLVMPVLGTPVQRIVRGRLPRKWRRRSSVT